MCAAGSVRGREHARLQRNNQDGVALVGEGALVAAVVTDGCSSGRASEVGAKFAAAALAPALLSLRGAHADDDAFVAAGFDALLALLRPLVAPFATAEARRAFVRDHLLFTFLAAVFHGDHAIVFGVGDGVLLVEGARHVIEAGPDNAPPYAAYRLLADDELSTPVDASPVVHYRGRASAIAIATDGAVDLGDDLAPLAADPRLAANPTLLHKALVARGEIERRLADDTTVAVVRARPSAREVSS